MTYEFVAPSFVQENDVDTIHDEMLQQLPSDIDTLPGGFPWDFTRPTALIKSEMVQFHLIETLKLMFPQFSYGDWLDLHGEQAGVKRKEAGYARGTIKIYALPNTKIDKGTIVSTQSDYEEAIEFATNEDACVGESGEIEIPIVAILSGTKSNVAEETVTLMRKPIKGITSIINETILTGGTEEEEDEDYLERIMEANSSDKESYIGNDSDYERWAKEVIGVGTAKTIAEWDGPTTVKLVVIDSNGQPANNYILQEVYDLIMSPEDRSKRKAPIGAVLTVVAPSVVSVSYSFQLSILEGYETEQVIEIFKQNLLKYYALARKEGVLKYSELYTILRTTTGVDDFSNFLVNGEMGNITLKEDEYPQTAEVIA